MLDGGKLVVHPHPFCDFALISYQTTELVIMTDIEEARKAMIAKRFGGNAAGASTGGAGTVRRKNKGTAKAGGGTFKFRHAVQELKY